MASMRDMLDVESAEVLKSLTFTRSRKSAVPPQKEMPDILEAIQAGGCDAIYIEDTHGLVVAGLADAHWTKDELALISRAMYAGEYVFKQTWRNTWAVVISC